MVLGTTEIDAVAPPLARSERGLMGLAVSPAFQEDAVVYVSYTVDVPGFLAVKNVVDRWRLVSPEPVANLLQPHLYRVLRWEQLRPANAPSVPIQQLWSQSSATSPGTE